MCIHSEIHPNGIHKFMQDALKSSGKKLTIISLLTFKNEIHVKFIM